MTGFGRAEGVVNGRKVTVEVRALNSRQLDLSVKTPGLFRELEMDLRALAADVVVRGKADLTVTQEGTAEQQRAAFDRELIRSYHEELRAIAEEVAPGERSDLLSLILRLPDVLTTAADRIDEAGKEALLALVSEALRGFNEFRASEGSKLREELAGRVGAIGELLGEVEGLDGARMDRTRDRLRGKLAELKVEVDPERFEQELVFYLEKLDITEEKMRLRTHCDYFLETMASGSIQGRKLNFITQEMGREINTLGSKANDSVIQRLVVRMKDELEKVKEQVLNVL